jgi:hypothetical protein
VRAGSVMAKIFPNCLRGSMVSCILAHQESSYTYSEGAIEGMI